MLPCIGEAIQTMLDDANHRADEAKAEAMKSAIMKFEFIYTLVVVCHIMSATKELCVKLQGMSEYHLCIVYKSHYSVFKR